MKDRNAEIKIIVSMAIFGTIAPFVRYIPLSSGEVALCRAILAVLLIGVFLLVSKNTISFDKIKKQIPLLIVSGAALAFNWILLFEAYKYTTVSMATLCYYFAPVLVTLICPIVFKERITGKQIICSVMSTVGIVLIIDIKDIFGGSNNIVGILFGLGAAILYATVVILNKFGKEVGGIQRTFFEFVAAVIILLPYVFFTSGYNVTTLDIKGLVALIIVGLVHTGITYCMYFSSLDELTGQKTAILSYIDPLVAILVSVLILNESMNISQIIGGILVLGFTLINEIELR
ncbi:MAG: EamA family transporter [Lachnospiraceae bacterium]|nr:EamA family transporter [Candidatus Colinaster equi]